MKAEQVYPKNLTYIGPHIKLTYSNFYTGYCTNLNSVVKYYGVCKQFGLGLPIPNLNPLKIFEIYTISNKSNIIRILSPNQTTVFFVLDTLTSFVQHFIQILIPESLEISSMTKPRKCYQHEPEMSIFNSIMILYTSLNINNWQQCS